MGKGLIGIVMGSDSDLSVMKGATDVLDRFGVDYEVMIASAHRAPDKVHRYACAAEKRGVDVIIAGAGVAAHLAGVIAAVTTVPVIGVPIFNAPLGGMDALYSIVQMPPGIPVATVGLNNARNAGLLAVQMLSLRVPALRTALREYKEGMAEEVEVKDARLQKLGIDGYLAAKEKI